MHPHIDEYYMEIAAGGHDQKPDQLAQLLYLSQTQYKAPIVPFVGAGNT